MPIDRDRLSTLSTKELEFRIARMDQLFYVNEDYNMRMSLRKSMEELKQEVERRKNAGVAVTRRRGLR